MKKSFVLVVCVCLILNTNVASAEVRGSCYLTEILTGIARALPVMLTVR